MISKEFRYKALIEYVYQMLLLERGILEVDYQNLYNQVQELVYGLQIDVNTNTMQKEESFLDEADLSLRKRVLDILHQVFSNNTLYDSYNDSVIYKVWYSDHIKIFVFGKYSMGFLVKFQEYARGGVRISSRDDYLSEVYQLALSQNEKNICIAPGGSKGAFRIVNREEQLKLNTTSFKSNSEDIKILAYKEFVNGIMQVDDSIFIAPDVGTAEMSVIANSISIERGYWSGEAFATGSTVNGISHKVLGITSKGGYEVLKAYGFDMHKNASFTAIGIGGMAGDVFGNFMILSKNIRLLAAFDHQHVFIDPNPDALKSYEERVRLQKMKSATWQDYQILSEGGRIYSRNQKEVQLTYAIRKLIGYDAENIAMNLLIKKILQMHVDVMISGGVGTYIVDENDHIDLQNKDIQCLAKEVQVDYIIEMGNLTISKKALSDLSAKTLTSRIDSSAGVICSDFEVNIKLLSSNIEVMKYTGFIENMTLLHMHHKGMTIYANYDNSLSVDKYLQKLKFINEEVLRHVFDIMNKKYLLMFCFPEELHEVYYDDILHHKFANEIFSSFISNMIIYVVGIKYIDKLLEQTTVLFLCNYIVKNYDIYLSYFQQRVFDISLYKEEQYKNYLIFLSAIHEID